MIRLFSLLLVALFISGCAGTIPYRKVEEVSFKGKNAEYNPSTGQYTGITEFNQVKYGDSEVRKIAEGIL